LKHAPPPRSVSVAGASAVAEGDGVGRANRSLTRRVERGGLDVVFYYRY
jgi:hypothetical protein